MKTMTNKAKRLFSSLLSLMMVINIAPPPLAFAAETYGSGFCPHHTEHTDECGYIAPTGEQPCNHEHTEECYKEGASCTHEHDGSCYSDGLIPSEGEGKTADACAHVCTEDSGCITCTLDCQHAHDEKCGYVPAEAGQPCGYVCQSCTVQELIDALPDADTITAESAPDAEAKLARINEAKVELTDEELDELDTARYEAVVSALMALEAMVGTDQPQTSEGDMASVIIGDTTTNYPTVEAAWAAAQKADSAKIYITKSATITNTLEMTSGEITLEINKYSVLTAGEKANPMLSVTGGTLNIRGGGKLHSQNVILSVKENGKVNLSYCKLNSDANAIECTGCNIGDLLAEERKYTAIVDGIQKPVTDLNSTSLAGEIEVSCCSHETINANGCPLCGTETIMTVKIDGGTNYYTDFRKALYEATGKTAAITLLKNTTITGGATVGGLPDFCKLGLNGLTEDSENVTADVSQSGTEVKAIVLDSENNTYTYGDTITVNATASHTGNSPAPSMLTASLTEPTTGQMALYYDDKQVSLPVNLKDGKYTMTTTVKDLVKAGATYDEPVTLTAMYTGSLSMAEGVGTLSITLKRKTLDITNAKLAAKTYDKTPYASVTDVTLSGFVNGESLMPGQDYTAKATFDNPNAGTGKTATVTVTLANTVKNYSLPVNTFPLTDQTISAKEITANVIVNPASYTYTGEAIAPTTVTVKDGDTPIQASEYIITYGNNTDVGAATVMIKDKEKGNYTFSDVITTFFITEASIKSAEVTVSGSYTYNGTALEPAADDVSVKLGKKTLVQGKDYTVDVTNNVNAGDANVTVTGNGNYTGTATGNFKIAQAPLTITAKEQTIIYGSNITQATDKVTTTGLAIGDTLESVTLTASTKDVPGGNIIPSAARIARTTSTRLRGDVTQNYNITYQPGTLTINKAQPVIKFNGYPNEVTYSGKTLANPTAEHMSITGAVYNDVKFIWSSPPGNVGTYTITATIPETKNTKKAQCAQSVTIIPKTVNPQVTVNPTSYEYDGTAKKPAVTVMDGDTKIDEREYTVEYENNIAVGNATVKIIDAENGNYNVNGEAKFIITKASLATADVTLAGGPFTYDGTAKVPVITVKKGETTVAPTEYDVSYSNTNGGSGDHIHPGTVTVTVTAKTDGSYYDSNSAEFIIQPKALTPAISGNTTKVYDGTKAAAGLSITLTDVVKDDEVTATAESYAYDTSDAGKDKTITATGIILSGTAAGNYTLSSNKATIAGIIEKSKPTIMFNSYPTTAIYFGTAMNNPTAEQLTITGAGYGDVQFSWSGTPINAGTYTITATIPETKNTEKAAASQSVTISPKTVTASVTVMPASYEYDGTAKKPDVTVMDGDTKIDEREYTVEYENNIAVGNATVKIIDAENGNYNVNGEAKFIITKPSLTTADVMLAGEPFTYDGTAKVPVITVKRGETTVAPTEYDVSYSNTNGGIGDHTHAGTVTVAVTAKTDGNYTDSNSAEFTIQPKALTPAISGNTTKAYDGTKAAAGLSITLADTVKGDEVSATASSYAYNTSDAGKDKTITATGITLSGTAAGNYTLSSDKATIAGIIEKATNVAAPVEGTDYTLNYPDEKLAFNANCEVSTKNDGTGEKLTSGDRISDYFGKSLYIRKIEDNNHAASGWAEIKPAERPTLEDLTKTDETLRSKSDGTLSGMKNTMEYRLNDASSWTAVTDDSLTNLPGGTKIEVRAKATTYAPASVSKTYTIAEGKFITITFKTGAKEAEMPDPLSNLNYGARIDEPQERPKAEDTDFDFTGWFKDEACTTPWNFNQDTVTEENVILYAGWKQVYLAVSGTVNDSENKTVSGATVKLMKGNKEIDKSTSGADGTFKFANHVRVGTYNVVTLFKEQTKTSLVTITTENGTVNITLPPEGVNSKLTVNADTPDVVVGGLDDVAMVKKSETGVEKVTVSMRVEAKPEADAEGAEKIKEVARRTDGKNAALEYFDVVVTAFITKNDATTKTEEIKEPPSAMELVVPFDFKGKKDIAVYCYHKDDVNESAEKLRKVSENTIPDDEGTYRTDSVNGLIRIYAKKFSTYAIGYTASFNVTFNAGEGTVSPASANTTSEGKLSSADIPTPTRTDYTFQGWYTDSGEKVTENTVFKADTTVTAHWEPINKNNVSGSSGLGGSGSYSIGTSKKPDNGTVSIDKNTATNGSTVTITVTPDEGYVLDTLTVTDVKNNKLMLTDKGDGKYTFIMPDSKVNVEARFVKADEMVESPAKAFSDLIHNAWYQEAVEYVLSEGIMSGYGNGRFGPDENLSRAQLAQILYNREGRPESTGESIFTDVRSGKWYTDAIIWANQKNVVGGYGNGLFGPDDPITREQLAVMLWRYAGNPPATNKELHFFDVDEAGTFALEALQWALENGIITGYGNGRIDPKGLATRAQVAQMLMRYLKGIDK